MKLTIKTEELQGMVGRVSQCVSNNKLIPLTSLISIAVEDNVLKLTTTDATIFYYAYSNSDITCEDFEVSVIADLFVKLIQKTTSENVTIEVEGEVLKVTGNGTYTFELPLDEDGVIKFPVKVNDENSVKEIGKVTLSNINNIISANKASLAVNMEYPVLTYYYCGEEVITSDRKNICENNLKVFDTPILISSTLMNLLSTVSSEDIKVTQTDIGLWFETDHEKIYTPIKEEASSFPITAIKSFASSKFPAHCKVARGEILSLLDRLSLFVDSYDKKGIYITVDESGLLFSSKKSKGKEVVKYTDMEGFENYACCINIEMLKNQLMSLSSDVITLYFGSEIAIKLEDKGINLTIALIEDSEE